MYHLRKEVRPSAVPEGPHEHSHWPQTIRLQIRGLLRGFLLGRKALCPYQATPWKPVVLCQKDEKATG